MPASDILNPTTVWEEDIEDSMTPNYGFTRKRTSTKLNKKAVGGTPWTRETQNTGHSFNFSWLARTWACVQRLKWYGEQYEDGFFTIIDWDGGGRQYVGRFTTEVIPVETGNGMWDVQNVTFEEIPQQAMLEYPSDWAHDAIAFFITNDFSDQKLATSGIWAQTVRAAVAGAQGTEHVSLSTVGTAYTTMDDTGIVGDWACYEYRGYGFRLYMLQGPEFGSADLYIDDVFVQTLNLYAATEKGPQIVYAQPSMPLDIHRVKVVCDGASFLPLPVVNTAPVLQDLAGTLSVALASDILGGTLAITNALGAVTNLTLGTAGTTDTLANLAATLNAGGYGITATVTGGTAMTLTEALLANIVGSSLTEKTTPGNVFGTPPVLASLAGTLSVGTASDILGGSLAITNAVGAISNLTLGTSGTTDTLANLAATINASGYGITATVTGGTAMTFAEPLLANIVGSNLTDTTPGIDGTLSLGGGLLGGSLTITDATGATHAVSLGAAGTTDTLANLAAYLNVTNAAWGITATITGGTAMTFGGTNSTCNVVGSCTTGVSWYALEVMR